MNYRNIKSISLAVIALLLGNLLQAQCFPDQLYDKIVSGYHGSIALLQDGSFQLWGEYEDSTGVGNVLSPQNMVTANYPELTGTPMKAAIGGAGGSDDDQFFILSSTGLFVWGTQGEVVSTTLTTTTHFRKIKYASITNADTFGLPTGVTPSQVSMLFATSKTLAIVTTSGNAWILTQSSGYLQGSGSTSTSPAGTTWYEVQTSSGTALANVSAVRGVATTQSSSAAGAMMAITTTGSLYAWGPSVLKGNATASASQSYATAMTIPSVTGTPITPYMIGVSGGSHKNSSGAPSFYVVGTNGYLFSLGNNDQHQLGTWGTTSTTSWVAPTETSGGQVFDSVTYFSVQEAGNAFPAIAVVQNNNLWAWGESSDNMLGYDTTSDASSDVTTDPHYPYGFIPGSDIALFPEVGGHTLVYLKDGSAQFCYVGHKIDGSMGDGTSTQAYPGQFDCANTPSVWVCGSVPTTPNDTTSTIAAARTTINANGTDTTLITVQLYTGYCCGDSMITTTGGTLVMYTTAGTISSVTDNNNGTYTAILTSTTTATTATISYALEGSSGLKTCTVAFSAISPITGVTTVATGNNITLSDATSGGTWSASNTAVGTINSTTGVVGGIDVGTETITYTKSGQSVTYVVTVTIAPDAGFTTVVTGNNITLTNASAGGTWTASNALVGTINSSTGVVTGVNVGTETATYTDGGQTATYVVTVTIAPVTGLNTVVTGNPITLGDASTGGTWTASNALVGTINSSTGVLTGINVGTETVTYTDGGQTATYVVTVTIAPVTGLNTVVTGNPITLSDASTGGTWTASNALVGTINSSTGVLTGINVGTETVTYTDGGQTATYVVTVTIAPVTGLNTVVTGNPITLGDASTGGTWTASNALVGTINSSTGVLTGINVGTETVTYTDGGQTATYVVTVTIAPVTGLNTVVTGNPITLSDASTGGTWTASNALVGTINSSTGVLTGINVGTETVTYTDGGQKATYVVTVTIAPVTGLNTVVTGNPITLGDASTGGTWTASNALVGTINSSTGVLTGINVGTETVTYTDGGQTATYVVTVTIAPVTGLNTVVTGNPITLGDASTGGTWTASNALVGTINSSTGVLTGINVGTETVTYTDGGQTATYVVTVTIAPVTGLNTVVTGNPITLGDASTGGTWTASNALVGTINSTTGVLTGINVGTETVTYTDGGQTATYVVTVTIAPVTGLNTVVTGNPITLGDASTGGTWTASNALVGTINSSTGVLTGINVGTETVTYTDGGQTATYVVTVTIAPVTGLNTVVTGNPITLGDASTGGTWTASNALVGTINSTTGVLTGINVGTETVTYTDGGQTAIYVVTVTIAPITGTTTVGSGSTTDLADISSGGTWSSSNAAVGTISTTGVVTGISSGTTTITYTDGGQTTVTVVTVTASSVAAIVGTPTVCAGATTTLTDATTGGTWSSSNAAVGTVATTGQVTGVSAGTVTITYTVSGTSVIFVMTVNPLPSAGTATASQNTLCIGYTITFSDGVSGGTWSTNNTNASINASSGVATGVAVGLDTIKYTVANSCGMASSIFPMNILPVTYDINTFVGTGTAGYNGDGSLGYLSQLNAPNDVYVDNSGNVLIAEGQGNRVRKVTPDGKVWTIAGNGTAGYTGDGGQSTAAEVSQPIGLYEDASGNIYVNCNTSYSIRKISTSGIITTIAGTPGTAGYSGDGGAAVSAKLNNLTAIIGDAAGNLYFCDAGNNRVRMINTSGIISTIAGTGTAGYTGNGSAATLAEFNTPRGLAFDNEGNMYIADALNQVIRKLNMSTGIVTLFAGTGVAGHTGDGGAALSATFRAPTRLAYNNAAILYVSDQNNNVIRQINLNTNIINAAAGDAAAGYSGDSGPAISAEIKCPVGIAFDKYGNFYDADNSNHRVRVTSTPGSIRITGPASVSTGATATYTAHSFIQVNNTYQWSLNGSPISGATNGTYTDASPVNGNVYSCIVTIVPPCSSFFLDTSNSITLTVGTGGRYGSTTGIASTSLDGQVSVFPNPFSSTFTIHGSGLDDGAVDITVYDELGRELFTTSAQTSNGAFDSQINAASYVPGMYFITVSDINHNSARLKCIKQ